MQIDTGNLLPRYQLACRTPFAIREEIFRQLTAGSYQSIIKLSLLASPVFYVRIKMDPYVFVLILESNAVNKPEVFPLPWIDDLLDQLGKSKFLSTLDLATVYWEVQIHLSSKQKTAFMTHKGLDQFNVMPFVLCNAPVVLCKKSLQNFSRIQNYPLCPSL